MIATSLVLFMTQSPLLAASTPFASPVLVADIEPGPNSSDPNSFLPMIDRALFRVDGSTFLTQVWVTDGTPAGTSRLVAPGLEGSGGAIWFRGPVGREFTYFIRDGAWDRNELWITDGTPDGTHELLPFEQSIPTNSILQSQYWESIGRFLFWSAQPPFGKSEPWISDGTSEGTHSIGSVGSAEETFTQYFWVGQRVVYFTSYEEQVGIRVWVTDGSIEGTRIAFQLEPSDQDFVILLATERDELVYARYPHELPYSPMTFWRYRPGLGNSYLGSMDLPSLASSPRSSAALGRGSRLVVLLVGPNESHLIALDLDAESLEELLPAGGDADLRFTPSLSPVPRLDRLVFRARSAALGEELWTTDGTPAGTRPLLDICPGPCSSLGFSAPIAGGLWLQGQDSTGRSHSYWSYGTESSTTEIASPCAGPCHGLTPYYRADFGRFALVLARVDEQEQYQIWAFDSSDLTLQPISHFAPPNGQPWRSVGSFSGTGTKAGKYLVFAARADFETGMELWGIEAWPEECASDARGLCLEEDRFSASASWIDFEGNGGPAHAVQLTSDTGYFWYFDSANVESVTKVLDGTGINGNHWVFFGSLSNVDFELAFEDRVTGRVRRYHNAAGEYASVGDIYAFADAPSSSSSASSSSSSHSLEAAIDEWALPLESSALPTLWSDTGMVCEETETRLCLQQGRFAVDATWRDFEGNSGVGMAVPLSADTGYFWFFNDANVEAVIKVLDGRPINDRFWVYYGALSNVEYTLTVTDTLTGAVKQYMNPSGRFASVGDNDAF